MAPGNSLNCKAPVRRQHLARPSLPRSSRWAKWAFANCSLCSSAPWPFSPVFLWKISITTLPPADEAVAELLESIFSEPASVYVRAATGKAVVSVYLARVSDWSTQTSDALRAGLRRMKSDGASIGSGRITARKIRQEDWAE